MCDTFLKFYGEKGGVYRTLPDDWDTSRCQGRSMGRMPRKGAYGHVYQAATLIEPPSCAASAKVAIKHMEKWEAEGLSNPGPGLFDIYGNELRVLSSVAHPGIVRLLDFGSLTSGPYRHDTPPEANGRFIVEELCRGVRIDFWGSMEGADEWRRFAASFLDALTALHEAGFVHADLSGSNVIYDGETSKLLDFGSSRTLAEARRGEIVGVHQEFAAPELLGKRPYDQRADIFAAAKIVHLPLYYAGLSGLRSAVEPVLERAWSNEPGKRNPTAESLKEDLLSVAL